MAKKGEISSDLIRASKILDGLKLQKKTSDSRLGEITIYSDPTTNTFIAQKTITCSSTEEAESHIKLAQQRQGFNHPYIARLLDYSVVKQKGLCSTSIVISLFYEMPKKDLQAEVNEKRQLTHTELTHILYQQLQAGDFLERQGLYCGNINPSTIAYDRANIVSKMVVGSELKLSPELQKSLKKAAYGLKTLCASQKVYNALQKGDKSFTFDPVKEDVFCLGITLLESGLNRPIRDIYQAKGGFDLERFNEYVADFSRIHAENVLLISAISTMLILDETQRPTFSEMIKGMQSYEKVQPFLAAASKPALQQTPTTGSPKYLENIGDKGSLSVGRTSGQIVRPGTNYYTGFNRQSGTNMVSSIPLPANDTMFKSVTLSQTSHNLAKLPGYQTAEERLRGQNFGSSLGSSNYSQTQHVPTNSQVRVVYAKDGGVLSGKSRQPFYYESTSAIPRSGTTSSYYREIPRSALYSSETIRRY